MFYSFISFDVCVCVCVCLCIGSRYAFKVAHYLWIYFFLFIYPKGKNVWLWPHILFSQRKTIFPIHWIYCIVYSLAQFLLLFFFCSFAILQSNMVKTRMWKDFRFLFTIFWTFICILSVSLFTHMHNRAVQHRYYSTWYSSSESVYSILTDKKKNNELLFPNEWKYAMHDSKSMSIYPLADQHVCMSNTGRSTWYSMSVWNEDTV